MNFWIFQDQPNKRITIHRAECGTRNGRQAHLSEALIERIAGVSDYLVPVETYRTIPNHIVMLMLTRRRGGAEQNVTL